jgi:Tfp pilus assembly protein PilV
MDGPPAPHGTGGFALFEVLVSALVLAVATLACAGAFGFALRAQQAAIGRQVLTGLAADAAEILRAAPAGEARAQAAAAWLQGPGAAGIGVAALSPDSGPAGADPWQVDLLLPERIGTGPVRLVLPLELPL